MRKSKTLTNSQKLKGFRLQNKMSQTELGKIVGKNFRTISNYEKGYRSIPEDVITKLNKDYHLKLEHSKVKTTKTTKTVAKVTKPVKYSFAKVISALRNSMKLTQTAFAKKFSFVPSHLWNIEKGNTETLSVRNLKAFSKAGVDLNTLIK